MRRALLAASAIFCRSAANHGGFALSTLIAASVILVLAGCSASSPFSGQANKPNPKQTAGVAAIPNAAAISPAQEEYADSLPYPKQSLADLFRDSTQTPAQSQTQTQTVPHPPSTYTPSSQPYSPTPGQQSYGAPPAPSATAAATPPANPDPTDSLPYPKQSLIDLFSNK